MKKYNNNIFNIENINQTVNLKGWVSKKRDLGGLIFIDLRDRSGIIQLVVRPDSKYYNEATTLKNEAVIEVNGIIKERENKNKNISTGEIEVEINTLTVLGEVFNQLPFVIFLILCCCHLVGLSL